MHRVRNLRRCMSVRGNKPSLRIVIRQTVRRPVSGRLICFYGRINIKV